MSSELLDKINDAIARLEEFDFEAYIADKYPFTELTEICFDTYNANEFKKLIKDTIVKLKKLVESDIKYMLPEYIPDLNGYSTSYTLPGEISNLIKYLQDDNKTEAKNRLERIIKYYLVYGNWDRRINYRSSVAASDLDSAFDRIKMLDILIDSEIVKNKQLNTSLSDSIQDIKDKITELDTTLENSLSTSEKISELKNKVDTTVAIIDTNNKNIETVNKSVSELKEEITTDIEAYKKDFNKIKTQNDESLNNSKEANNLKNEILTYRDEIKRLVGAAADGALGSKFDERKIQIKANINILLALIISA